MTEATQAPVSAGAEAHSQESGSDADIIRRLSSIVDGEQTQEPESADTSPDDDRPEGLQLAQQPEEAKPEAAKDSATDSDPVVTVKVDGAEKAVKQSELIAEYQKGQASAKRFEEAAQLRKSVEAEKARIAQERGHLQEALQTYQAQLEQLTRANEPDWEQLLQNDPAEFQKQRYYHDQRQQQLQQARAAQAYLSQQQHAEAHQAAMQTLTEQHSKLLEALPEWKDEGKAKAAKVALREHLTKHGFSDNEIAGLSDHRSVIVAHKAMLYDQLIADQAKARENASQKLQKLPPPRMERPGSGEIRADDGRTRAMQRLNKSGSVQDAASVLAGFIN